MNLVCHIRAIENSYRQSVVIQESLQRVAAVEFDPHYVSRVRSARPNERKSVDSSIWDWTYC